MRFLIVSIIFLSLICVNLSCRDKEETAKPMEDKQLLLKRATTLKQSDIGELGGESRELLYTLHEANQFLTMKIPPNAVLDTALGIDPLIQKIFTGVVDFNILIVQNKQPKCIFKESFNLSELKRDKPRWHPRTIDLADYAGEKVTFVFNKNYHEDDRHWAKQVYDLSPTDFMLWARPQVRPKKLKGKPNVILISIDTLRADHLHYAGYARRTSPNIDNFVKKGCFFTTVVSQAPWTTPAHFSIFTSTYPRIHKGNQPYQILTRRWNKKVPIMADILRDKGYLTAAFTGKGTISAKYGFYRGFDFYNSSDTKTTELILEKTLEWLRTNRQRTFFLFFHTYEVHEPYSNEHFAAQERIDSKDTIKYRTACYDGDIWSTDNYMGKLFAEIEALDLIDNTLIVFTSDHGEYLGSSRKPPSVTFQFGHGDSLYDEQLLVPLWFVGPGITPRENGIEHQVRSIDILPTVMEYLDFEQLPHFQGKSLMAMIEGKDQISRPAFSEATTFGTERESIRFDGYKFIHRLSYGQLADCEGFSLTPLYELYDLNSDLREQNNLAKEQKSRVNEYRRFISRLFPENSVEIEGGTESESIDISQDTDLIEALKSLGYVQ